MARGRPREAHILGLHLQGLFFYHGNLVACLLLWRLPRVKEKTSRAQLPTFSGGFWVAWGSILVLLSAWI